MCTGGQGGAVICNTEDDYWNVRRAADRGKPFNLPAGSTNCIPSISCNMDEFHAAVGRAQLRKLPDIVARRKEVVGQLKSKFFNSSKAIAAPALKDGFDNCYWWLRLKFNTEAMNCTKDEFCEALMAEGLTRNVSIIPHYRHALPAKMDWYKNHSQCHPWNNPFYKGDAFKEYPTPNCDKAMDEHFILFVLESFGEEETDMIAHAFRKVEDYYVK